MASRGSTTLLRRSETRSRPFFDDPLSLPAMCSLGYRALWKLVKDGLERTPCRSEVRRWQSQ